MTDDEFFTLLAALMTVLICTPGSLLIPAIGIAFSWRWFRQQRRSTHTEDAHDHNGNGASPAGR